VLYKSLRAGRDSVAVAGDLGIKPSHVRQIVARANAVAIQLGFESFAPHGTRGKKKGPKRRTVSLETRERLRAAHLGKKLSAETRAKIGAANKGLNKGKYVGRKMSPEWLANLGAAQKRAWERRKLARDQVEEPATYRDPDPKPQGVCAVA
jgi:hypothetical protein